MCMMADSAARVIIYQKQAAPVSIANAAHFHVLASRCESRAEVERLLNLLDAACIPADIGLFGR